MITSLERTVVTTEEPCCSTDVTSQRKTDVTGQHKTDVTGQHTAHSAPAWVGFKRAIPAASFAGVCAAAAFTELSADEGTVLCPFRLFTGGWCPGCGCTRALKALVRGNVSDSVAMNPWTIILFVQALFISVAILIVPARTKTWLKRHQVLIGSANIAVGLALWAYRLSVGTIPLPFS